MDEAGGKGVRLIRYDEISFWNQSILSVVIFLLQEGLVELRAFCRTQYLRHYVLSGRTQ